MATRTATATTEHARPDQHGRDDLEDVVTAAVRMLARLAVRSSSGPGAATFKSIAVYELKIATEHEAALVEQWLSEHP